MGVPSWMDQAAQAQKRRRRMMVAIVTVSGCVPRKRLDWNARNQRLLLEGQFKQCYRMGVHFFEKLFLLIWPMLTCDEVESKQRTGIDPITPQNTLQMTISWLAGSNYHTTGCLGGVSPSVFYDITKDIVRYCFGSPGSVGDSIAIKKWTLSDAILALPPGYYCAGDKAYPLSDSFLVPYN
ncbi:hypothetical protein PPTG_06407 [Phytophthora nicotianae INRA-310]|uniref:DDE Tnp4 domain-containing protein n=1 Tax=Phytophthora nicotianae (strain INRA-310) TaxID=761204 RepID=W2QSZ1_PHYN3|nr:hypothetical protein PPTG_06407 [Phytophthora nicotianae INRA-310]ETN16223.1 hypothetical protein PPTG_06407 [Phytophthora nicotianae INRA-310]